ncbi:hypothetical protein PFISCL1PPCAC_28730, partial [Pristionchus fissidentatus]
YCSPLPLCNCGRGMPLEVLHVIAQSILDRRCSLEMWSRWLSADLIWVGISMGRLMFSPGPKSISERNCRSWQTLLFNRSSRIRAVDSEILFPSLLISIR